MKSIPTADVAKQLLDALGEQLQQAGAAYELVVVGGSALPAPLATARDRVARDFQLPSDWLNDGPASLLALGLPEGFMERARREGHGPALTVWYASRFDQIHLKLYAAVDQGPGRHESDLRALEPTPDELIAAALWSRRHDPSPGHRHVLEQALAALGVRDASLGP